METNLVCQWENDIRYMVVRINLYFLLQEMFSVTPEPSNPWPLKLQASACSNLHGY